MNTQLNITLIKNPLEPLKSAVSAPAIYTGGSVIDAIRSVTGDVSPDEIVISVDQMIVEAEFIPEPGSQIVFCVAVRGAGGGGNAQQKGMLRMVAMMAIMIAAPYAAAGLMGTSVAAMGQAGWMLASGIQVAGAIAINALLPPPEFGVANLQTAEALEKSQNYGWSPGRNAMYEGAILPSIIGERRVTPPCIGAYRYTDDNKQQQYVRMLFAIADDLIEDIEPADVFINEQVITEYPSASYIHTIGNDIEDEAPEWFDEAITENQHMLDISEQAEVFKEDVSFSNFTEGTFQPAVPYKVSKPIEVLTFRCFFPLGMWHLVKKKKSKKSKNENHEGQDQYRWVKERYGGFKVGVQYREIGATSWNLKYFTVTPGKKYNSTFYRTFSVGSITPSNKGYEVQFTVKDPKGMAVEIKSITGRSSLTGVGFVTTKGLNVDKIGVGLLLPNGLHYIKDSGGFGYHEVELVIETRKHGSLTWNGPSDGVSFGDATSAELRKTYVFDNLPPGQYDIRAYVDQAMPTDNRYQHTVMLEYIQESVSHPLVYRGVALLAVDVMATNDLKGQYPVVEVKVRRSDYAPGRSSSNPAWAAYYRLIMRGIPEDRINLKEFEDWAAFCDLEKLTVALYLDAQLSLQTVLNQIGISGRGHVVSRGGYWGVIIDMPKVPKQTFGTNNIISGTFSETFLPAHDLANCIVAWFFDETKKYRKTSVEIRDPDIKKASDLKKTEITLYGVTKLEQAKSHAVYMLNHTRMTNRTVSWRSAIDAINCQVGDVIWLQHDVPEWGKTPGRVISADTKSVSCDIPLDFSDTENDTRQFRLCIRHMAPRTGEKTDFIEVRKVTNPYLISSPGNTSVSTFTLDTGETWERVPTRGCPVSIGWVTGHDTKGELLSLKQFRIINIERRTKTQEFNITAAEYYADAYIDDYIVTLPDSESGLKPVILPSAKSAWDVIGGVEQTYIALSWLGNAPLYYVYYQQKTTTGWSEWAFHTSTTLTALKIHNLQIGIDYQFSISVDNNPDTGTKLTLFHDKEKHEELIEPVTNIKCVQTGTSEWRGRDLDVTWNPFSMFSLKAYRVEILNTLNAVINSEVVTENRYHYSLEKNSHDHGGSSSASVRMRVVVIDDNNNEAVSVAQVMTNSLPTAVSNLRTTKGSGSQFSGRDLDIVWNPSTEDDFKAYEVTVSHGSADLRKEYVIAPSYRYTFAMNEEDGSGSASNSVVVKIRVIDAFNQASGISSATFTNPAPGIPQGLAGEQWMNGIRFLWIPNPEKDIVRYEYRLKIEVEAWGPWTPTKNTELQRFLSETESKTYNGKAKITIELRAIDTFGTPSGVATITQDTGSINVEPTPVDEIGQISGAFKDIPVIVGDSWGNNSPSAGSISWNSHELWHKGVMYDIHAGSTAEKYVYWLKGGTAYSTSATEPVLNEGDFIIAQNSGGTCILAWDSQANSVIGSAYIKSGAIIDLHVTELSAGKIKAGSIMTPGVYIGGAKYGGGGNQTLDDLKPAEGGATVGADWKSNLGNIPIRFADAPQSDGLYITPDFIGFYSATKWKSYIDAKGNFAFTGDTSNFIAWNGLKLTISGEILIQNPSDIRTKINVAEGATNDSAWRHPADITKINGGHIFTNTISLSSLNGANGVLDIKAGGQINVSAGKINIESANGLEVSGAGSIVARNGGGVIIQTEGSNQSTLKFISDPTSPHLNNSDVTLQYNNGSLHISPELGTATQIEGALYFGTISAPFKTISFEAENWEIHIEDLDKTAQLGESFRRDVSPQEKRFYKDTYINNMGAETVSTVLELEDYRGRITKSFYPRQKNTDCGQDVYAWNNLYFYVAHDKVALHLSSRVDSLKILHDMKAMKTPSKSSSGYPILDLKILPSFLTNAGNLTNLKSTRAINSRIFRNTGAFLDLTAAAVRQLDKKTDRLIKRLEKLEMKNAKSRKSVRRR